MTLRSIATYLAAASAALALQGCGGNDDIPAPSGEGGGEVTLELNVGLAENPLQQLTRSFPDSEDGTFEMPATEFEKVKTLRVVIVHNGDNRLTRRRIEHNRLVMMDPVSGAVLNDNLRFRCVSGEKKRIYLFANEASVDYDFTALKEGEYFPSAEIDAIQLERLRNAALIDNTPASPTRTYIPMSEFFDIDVPLPQNSSDFFRIEHLFLTRATVKFSFCISTAPDYPESGVSVTGIKVYGLADNAWYLPRDTYYSPQKEEPSSDPMKGREIINFTTPDDVEWSGYDYAGITPVEIKAGTEAVVAPAIYFPETKRKAGTEPFRVSVVLDDNSEFLSPLPLQLTEIPRNTHVKVNIRMTATGISPEVTLLPYTGVNLDPEFGIPTN